MTQYIADETHFKEVIDRVPKVKRLLWIGTADIKDLYVEERPFMGLLADLIKKGKEVRLIHAKEPGPNFREEFDHYPVLFTSLDRALCRPGTQLDSVQCHGRAGSICRRNSIAPKFWTMCIIY